MIRGEGKQMKEQKFFITSDLRNDRVDGEDQKIVPKLADVPVTSYLDVFKLFITEPLPAKAGRFGGLLKQPRRSAFQFLFFVLLFSNLKIVGIAPLL